MSHRSLRFISLLLAMTIIPCAFADSGAEHREAQDWPILLGTSGGNVLLRSDQYCCGGTLGALVQRGDTQYILSNNHVLGRSNLASVGEAVNQPGMIDQGCAELGTVANFSEYVEIFFKDGNPNSINYIDAAIAKVVDGAVDPDGAILDIGAITEATEPILMLVVEKSGRTSGHTQGFVLDIGVSVDVTYSMGCGDGITRVARFADQMMIMGLSGSFSAPGDSGSLIVEGMEPDPRAVGLLFAGNSLYTVANPISRVLELLNVTFPGGGGGTTEPPEPTIDPGTVWGTITNKAKRTMANVLVTLDGEEPWVTESSGWYQFVDVDAGQRSLTVSADGYKTRTRDVTITPGGITVEDFVLREVKGKGRGKPNRRSAIEHALKIKKKHEKKFFDIDGVVGSGVGLSKELKPAIKIYLKEDSQKARNKIPKMIEDVPIEIVITGEFEAF